MAEDLRTEFKNPGKDHRSAPFWSWNDRLDPKELRRQVRDMKAHGMGGFFMHSRVGLETPYMGREWMRCIQATVDEAARIGMNAWLYDEDRWPSGFAGGMVPARGEECRQKGLVMRTHRTRASQSNKGFTPTGRELAVFAARIDERRDRRDLLSMRRLKGDAKPKPGETVLSFTMETCPPREWHNGFPYSDNLSAKSVRAFLETTHIPYANALKKHIPRVVPGIFTDEPHVSPGIEPGPDARVIPWTTAFAAEFHRRRGYDIVAWLPCFFYDARRSAKVRHDYWRTVTELFVQNYSKQIGTWCRRNRLALTGHYLSEGNLTSQTHVVGAVMPHYVWQDVPGVDILTEQQSEYLTVKQCSSVAAQFGRKFVLSELYGCSGWEFTFEGMKWAGDWQYALGVSLRCPHLTLYTLRGCAKRDYPPSFNYNNTWWKYNRVHEDYFARLALMLTQGAPVRDVLLLHPIASAWAEYDADRSDRTKSWNRRLEAAMRTLLSHHRDFDLGDEMILKDYASVRDGRLRVRKMSYPVVVLPPMLTLSSSTVELLEELLSAGGHVIAVKPLANRVDASCDRRLRKIWKRRNTRVVDSPAELPSALDAVLPPRLRVMNFTGQAVEPVLSHLRRAAKRRVLFLANTDRNASYSAEVRFAERGSVEEWDPLTGEVHEVASYAKGSGTAWPASLGPAGSRLYVIDTAKVPAHEPAEDRRIDASSYPVWSEWAEAGLGRDRRKLADVFLGPVWRFHRTDPNVLVLDVCRWRLNGGRLSRPMPVWQAQLALRRKLSLRPVHDNGAAQRWTWVDHPKDVPRSGTEYHFAFRVDVVPRGKVSLVLEGSEHFTIRLNGKDVRMRKAGWYLDRSMHRIALPRLKCGLNTLVLSCNTVETMQVEDCFLIGDFGVDTSTRAITDEPETLHAGDWTLQGYTHYPGGMVYETTLSMDGRGGVPSHPHPSGGTVVEVPEGIAADRVRSAILRLGKFSAVVVGVRVNGKDAGCIPWRSADGLDIRAHLRPGANRIEIEVMGSPKNMLGPLHDAHGKTPWTGPHQFVPTGIEYTPGYVLWPWGLMDQVRIELYGKA